MNHLCENNDIELGTHNSEDVVTKPLAAMYSTFAIYLSEIIDRTLDIHARNQEIIQNLAEREEIKSSIEEKLGNMSVCPSNPAGVIPDPKKMKYCTWYFYEINEEIKRVIKIKFDDNNKRQPSTSTKINTAPDLTDNAAQDLFINQTYAYNQNTPGTWEQTKLKINGKGVVVVEQHDLVVYENRSLYVARFNPAPEFFFHSDSYGNINQLYLSFVPDNTINEKFELLQLDIGPPISDPIIPESQAFKSKNDEHEQGDDIELDIALNPTAYFGNTEDYTDIASEENKEGNTQHQAVRSATGNFTIEQLEEELHQLEIAHHKLVHQNTTECVKLQKLLRQIGRVQAKLVNP